MKVKSILARVKETVIKIPGLVRRFMKKCMPAFWLLLLCGVCAAVLILSVSASIKAETRNRVYTYDASDVPEGDYDCILVLGAGLRADGSPSDMLRDRIIVGCELYQKGYADRLLMSGDHSREDYDEVNAMKRYAMEHYSIESGDIFMDHAGFSTYESLYRAKEIFGAERILIVTQAYHMYRALYIAHELGLEAWGVSADLHTYRGQSYRNLREIAARFKDFFSVMCQAEPTYLGEAIPLSGNGDVTNDPKEG